MYPFSFIIIIFWIINTFKNNLRRAFLNQFIFTIFISIFIEVGYFLNSDIIKIEYWQMATILTFFNSIPLLLTTKITKHFFIYIAILLLNLLFLIIIPVHKRIVVGAGGGYENVMAGNASYIEPIFSKFTIFFFSLAVIQAISVLVAFKKFRINDFHYLIHKLSIGAKIIILIVVVEIIIRYLFNGTFYNNFIFDMFGQSQSTSSTSVLRGSNYALQGLTREASHLVYALFTALIVLFVENKISFNNKRNNLYIFIGIIEIIIAMAFSSLLIFVMILLMYIVYYNYVNDSKNHKLLWTIVIVMLIFLLSVPIVSSIIYSIENSYYGERFLSSTDDIIRIFDTKQDYFSVSISSTSTRIFSVIDSLSLLRFRPFFGVGLGTTFCHGSTALTLAETGILGLISYVYFYFFSVRIKNNKIRRSYVIIIFIWLVGNLFVSGPRLIVRFESFLPYVFLYLSFYYPKIFKSNQIK